MTDPTTSPAPRPDEDRRISKAMCCVEADVYQAIFQEGYDAAKAEAAGHSASPLPTEITYEQITLAQQQLYILGRWLPSPLVRAVLEAAATGEIKEIIDE